MMNTNITGTTPEEEYRKRNPSGHWFDRSSLRFFNSRIGQHAYGSDLKKLYFVSSEQCETGRVAQLVIPRGVGAGGMLPTPVEGADHPRLYTVRVMAEDGDISDIGGFQAFKSCSGATSAMRRAAKDGDS